MAANKIKSIKLKVYYVLSNQAEAFFLSPVNALRRFLIGQLGNLEQILLCWKLV